MIRILVVDDDALVRAALVSMLGGLADIEIVGEVSGGLQVVAAVDTHAPDVVLMDIRMPDLDGIAATTRLRARPAAPEVIVLTTFDTDADIVAALRAGASGYLLKDTPPADIVAAIRRVADGDPMLSPAVTRRLIDKVAAPEPDHRRRAQAAVAALNDRERDVLVAVGQGRTNAEIAAQLYLSVATVKTYISRLLATLGLDNRTQIALLAQQAYPDR